MLSAIISDTVLFRSPTTTEEDKETAKEAAEMILGLLEKYASSTGGTIQYFE